MPTASSPEINGGKNTRKINNKRKTINCLGICCKQDWTAYPKKIIHYNSPMSAKLCTI